MWYQKLIQPMLDAQTDTLLVVDAAHFLEWPAIQEHVKASYPQILPYHNELQLRLALRKQTQNMLVVFTREQDIPFAFLSMYAVVNLDIAQVFPLFDREVLLAIPYEDYAYIYAQYETLTTHRYEKLSCAETEQLLQPLLTSEEYQINKRVLELRNRLAHLKTCSFSKHETFGELSQVLGELAFIEHDQNVWLNLEQERIPLRQAFAQYIGHYYEDFVYHPDLPMHAYVVKQIFERSHHRNALICFDCMGFEEWQVIREYLEAKTTFQFEVNYSFAMLPSETLYSRTTLFAGRFYKELRASSLHNKVDSGQEKKWFYHALQETCDLSEQDIYFYQGLKPGEYPFEFDDLSDYSALGMIFFFIDQLTHNELMTKRILLNNIRTHLSDSRLDELIRALLDQGFRVFFTSDHGSIYAHGNGVTVPKDLTDARSKRYFITGKQIIAEEYTRQAQHAIVLQLKHMLGEEFVGVLTDDSIFASKHESELTHGGISLEEVVVPFIEVKM